MDIWADGKPLGKDKSLTTILLKGIEGAREPVIRIDSSTIILENIDLDSLTQNTNDGKTTFSIRIKGVSDDRLKSI